MQASVDLGGRRIIKKNFFKQKTAYEIGGSDWSSDVCSSDLNIIRKHMNDGWIPVEERLPEGKGNDGELIVTDKDGRVWSGIYYGITEETDEEPCFHKWDEEMWYCYKPDVIAWRPLPERYHPEPETEKPD